jgi:hypothetical protein
VTLSGDTLCKGRDGPTIIDICLQNLKVLWPIIYYINTSTTSKDRGSRDEEGGRKRIEIKAMN